MANLKASINFGLVHIPVEIVTAENRGENVSFHMLDTHDHSRIRLKRVNENTGKEVEWEDIVKGYEVSEGEYVVFTEEDLKALEADSNKSLEIDVFVDKDEIPQAFLETPYYIIPSKGGEKGYAVLEKALTKSSKYAVVQAVMRNKQQLAVIYPEGGGLVLNILRYAQELKDMSDILPASVSKVKISEKEMEMANRLVNQMSAKFKPENYKDTYADSVKEAVAKKARGKKVRSTAPASEKAPKKVVDIMALLSKSLKEKSIKAPRKRRAA